MRKYCLFIALATVAAMTVSCRNKNSKNAESEGVNEEIVEAAKVVLADDLLAALDEIGESLTNDLNMFDVAGHIAEQLTEKDKLIKPDYLFNPSEVNNLVTRFQKVSALGFLICERPVRIAYGMPLNAVDEAIGRLMIDLNYTIPVKEIADKPIYEVVKEEYEEYRERGELPFFWQFNFSIVNDALFLISKNPDLFFRDITEEQYKSFENRFISCLKAVCALAKYDPEVAIAFKVLEENMVNSNLEEEMKAFGSFNEAKQQISDAGEIIAARRSALLK
ncbi:MAG: hypothetical protein MJY61_02260 [Bacteroidales bacterium]|nr:hypothetical protein [Bacteroidales bacterium]